ncbi:MAG: YhjD/YihY/BrkB family envelope integrity protein [Planctomycetota bacterium]
MRNILKSIRSFMARHLPSPGPTTERVQAFLRYQGQLWKHCLHRFGHDRALTMAAALTYYTVFALVPVLVLAFLALRSAGAIDTREALRSVLVRTGIGNIVITTAQPTDDGPAVQPSEPGAGVPPTDGPPPATRRVRLMDKILDVVSGVESRLTLGRIGPVGFLMIIYAVIALLTIIERSLNIIFNAPRARSIGRRVLLYWAVVTITPILGVAAGYGENRLLAMAARIPGVAWLLAPLGVLETSAVTVLLLTAIYKYMPHTFVRLKPALGGALVAALLWFVARWGFGIYIDVITRRPSIYGALGLLPVFLLWMNLNWLILLLGAELAHTAASLDRLKAAEAAKGVLLGPWDLLAAILAVANHFTRGEGLMPADDVQRRLRLPEASTNDLLERLVQAGFLSRSETSDGHAYGMARPPARIGVLDVIAGQATALPGGGDRYDESVSALIGPLQDRAHGALASTTLADAVGGAETPPANA